MYYVFKLEGDRITTGRQFRTCNNAAQFAFALDSSLPLNEWYEVFDKDIKHNNIVAMKLNRWTPEEILKREG